MNKLEENVLALFEVYPVLNTGFIFKLIGHSGMKSAEVAKYIDDLVRQKKLNRSYQVVNSITGNKRIRREMLTLNVKQCKQI